jgi:hypothetical protein
MRYVLQCIALIACGSIFSTPAVAATACTSTLIPAATTPMGGAFSSIGGLSPSDVWAVGTSGVDGQTLAEHDTGSAFDLIPSPNYPGYPSALTSVAEVAPNDVWAVGYWSGYDVHELIEHWNGSTWRVLPADVKTYWDLQSVSAVPNDAASVFAVGFTEQHLCRNPLGCTEPVAAHWVPSKGWQVENVPIPQRAPYGALNATASVAGGTAYAVGEHGIYSNPQQLIERWTGTKWSLFAPPEPERGSLTAVAALSDSDVWVGGYQFNPYPRLGARFVEHWNGSTWTTYKLPSVTGIVNSIAAQSDSDVWVAGGSITPLLSTNARIPVLEHFDGTSWSAVPTASDGLQTIASAVVDFSGQALWVGTAVPAVNYDQIPVAVTTHC